VTIANSDDAIRLGIALVPENRKEQGLVLGMSGRENMTLPQLDRLQSLGFMVTSQEQEIFARYRKALSISTTGPHQPVGNLSGGNQQKIVIGKWLSTEPKLLILDEPTRGIDVGSKSEIHKLIGDLAEQGYAVLVISSEMPEIIGVSHRIVTMYTGEVTGEFSGADITEDNLIGAVAGIGA
jgi:ribose transport system ATP-binding protein